MTPQLRTAVLFLFVFGASAMPSALLAQTQQVTYTNRLPVYVGDLINETDATVSTQNAGRLCARLNNGIDFNAEIKITNVSVSNELVTISAANKFKGGESVKINKITTATFLQGASLTVLDATSKTFTAILTNANYAAASDSGTLKVKNSDEFAW